MNQIPKPEGEILQKCPKRGWGNMTLTYWSMKDK